MKHWILGCTSLAFCVLGCTSITASKEEAQVIEQQRIAISKSIVGWDGKSNEIKAQLTSLDTQIETLYQRIDEIQNRVRLLIGIESSEVCLNILPEDLARSVEIREAHNRWLAATQVSEEKQLSTEEQAILHQQFLQAVQRAIVTESTQLQMLTRDVERKEDAAARYRSQMLEIDRQIQDLEQTLKAL